MAGAFLTHYLRKRTPGCPGRAWPVWAIAGVLGLAYALDFIPPVPLVEREMHLGLNLEKRNGEMLLSVEHAPWYKPWRLLSNDLHVSEGNRVYCVSTVFAPRGISATLYHRWEHYDEKRGLALVVKEHTNPKDYKRKAVDTMDTEGRDWAEEMHRKDPKAGWRARLRFYTNVLIDDGLEDPYIAVWSQGISKQSAFNTIREYALETGSISNLEWKLKRNGQGTETNYTLIPSTPDSEPFKWDGHEFFNLEKVVREVPYPEQEAFYFGFDTPSVTATNIDW